MRGVCTLDALGAGLGEAGAASGDRLAVLDARRGEVFAALYSAAGERLWEPSGQRPEELAERIAGLARAGRCAADRARYDFASELARRGVEIPDDADPVHRVAARHICALAAAGAGEGEAGPSPRSI